MKSALQMVYPSGSADQQWPSWFSLRCMTYVRTCCMTRVCAAFEECNDVSMQIVQFVFICLLFLDMAG